MKNIKNIKKIIFFSVPIILLSGCGIKDPSFYDLKSPCVANEYLENPYTDISQNPCIRSAPNLNNHFDNQVQVM